MGNPSQFTSLQLLAEDSIIRVTFSSTLNEEQYSQLLEVAGGRSTCQNLMGALRELGARWQIPVDVAYRS